MTTLSFCRLRILKTTTIVLRKKRDFHEYSHHRLKLLCFKTSAALLNDMVHHGAWIPGREISTSMTTCIKNKDIYTNPIDDLQVHVDVPILSKESRIFQPSLEELKSSESLFVSGKHGIQHIKSVVNMKNLPETSVPEVAFIGRSNVGKSSLIKALFHNVPDISIKTSKKPGHTRVLQFFQIGKCFSIVDMPGYGYNMPEHFQKSVESYLQTRRRLTRTFLLIDATTGITQRDDIGLNMLEEFKVPYAIVLTKIDKANSYRLIQNIMSIVSTEENSLSNCCLPQPFLVSSHTLQGVPFLQAFLAYVTGSIEITDKQCTI